MIESSHIFKVGDRFKWNSSGNILEITQVYSSNVDTILVTAGTGYDEGLTENWTKSTIRSGATIIKKGNKMKATAIKVIDELKPYKKYLLLTAGLFLMDYFIFKGKFTKKLQSLCTKFFGTIYSKVDTFVKEL